MGENCAFRQQRVATLDNSKFKIEPPDAARLYKIQNNYLEF
jgi:hypothetical protein